MDITDSGKYKTQNGSAKFFQFLIAGATAFSIALVASNIVKTHLGENATYGKNGLEFRAHITDKAINGEMPEFINKLTQKYSIPVVTHYVSDGNNPIQNLKNAAINKISDMRHLYLDNHIKNKLKNT